MRHPIITMLDGTEVYVNLINAEVSRSIASQPHLAGLVKEILQENKLAGAEVYIEQDMGRTVGYDFVVTTKEGDNVFYAKVVHEETYTRFIKNRDPHLTRYVAARLRRDRDDDRAYELYAARIGRLTPPRPDTSDGSTKSRHYWQTHALIHTGEQLQARTVSKICPY